MTHREILLYLLTVGFEILLCALVYLRNLQQRLPFFTTHSTLLLMSTMGIALVYHRFGFRSTPSYNAYWITAGLIILARGFAIAELCRHELRAYRGVWALAWRILALLAVIFLGHAAADAWGQLDRFAIYGLTIERDVEMSSIVILLTMLLISRYYRLTLEPLHKWIAVGMSLVCVADIVNNTILRDAFTGPLSSWFHLAHSFSWAGMRSQVESANDLWNMIRTSGLIVSMSIWCYALRKPLPAPAKDPVLLPAEVYRELSPAVNLRLRAFNDRLLELLKP
jgi:hypothetical protein